MDQVHYGINYNNAFWDGSRMTYGDGDGVLFIPLNRGLDVVGKSRFCRAMVKMATSIFAYTFSNSKKAHELTHGVTSSTSNLVYRGQSGALNEAMSDIFAALVEMENGGSYDEVWQLGEAVFTPSIDGDALRSLKDPAKYGDYDYFPKRYRGDMDNGGLCLLDFIDDWGYHGV
jgi:bacillolysin